MENPGYVCSVCGKKLATKEELQKHFMPCWQRENPYHKSKPAPQTETINTRKVSNDIQNFFDTFSR